MRWVFEARKRLFALAVVAACLLSAGYAAQAREAPAPSALASGGKPNIVVVMADDLGEDSAKVVKGLENFAEGGADFENSFVSNSLCCPSRATFLRGQYSGNHGVTTNWKESDGAYPKFARLGHDRQNLVTRLEQRGYETAHYGKYLNIYTGGRYGKPPGWAEFVLVNNGNGYGYAPRVWENGKATVKHGVFHDDYTARRALDFIRSTKGQGKPFYMQVDLYSPHAPYTAPSRFQGSHDGTDFERKPSHTENLVDKPDWVKKTARWDATHGEYEYLEQTDANRRNMAEETELVAETLRRIQAALSDAGKARKTYVIFTSDNGLMNGEHRLPFYKQPPYEESIRVPLAVDGPGVVTRDVREMVLNNDLAPTILDIANAGIPSYMDGRSLLPLLEGRNPAWRDAFLVEHWVDIRHTGGKSPYPVPYYKAVRTGSEVYVQYTDPKSPIRYEREYYDLRKDPYQTENGAYDRQNAARISKLRGRLERLEACRGASCRAAEGTITQR